MVNGFSYIHGNTFFMTNSKLGKECVNLYVSIVPLLPKAHYPISETAVEVLLKMEVASCHVLELETEAEMERRRIYV